MPMWGYGINWPMTFGVLCVMLILSGFAGLLIWAFARRAPEPTWRSRYARCAGDEYLERALCAWRAGYRDVRRDAGVFTGAQSIG